MSTLIPHNFMRKNFKIHEKTTSDPEKNVKTVKRKF